MFSSFLFYFVSSTAHEVSVALYSQSDYLLSQMCDILILIYCHSHWYY